MLEGIPVVGRDQHARIDGQLGRGQQLVFWQVNGGGEQVVGHSGVSDADLVDHKVSGRGQPGRLGQDRVADRRGRPGRTGSRQLTGVERVAGRGGHDRGQLSGARLRRQQAADELGDLAVGQAAKPQPGHHRAALELGEPRLGRSFQFLLPQRADDQHALVPQPGREEGKQLPRRLVSPVQVFKHQEQRDVGGQPGQQLEHAQERPVASDEQVTRGVVVQQPANRLTTQRGQERAIGQGRPHQRR